MVWSLGITPVTMIITRKKKSVFIALIGNDYYQENEVCFIALIKKIIMRKWSLLSLH